MKEFKIEKNIDYYLKNKEFIKDFNQDVLLLGIDIFYQSKFKILRDDKENTEIVFEDDSFINFSYNRGFFSFSYSDDLTDGKIVCGYIYLYLNRNDYSDIDNLYNYYFFKTNDLVYKENFYIFLIESLGYYQNLRKNFTLFKLKSYINTIYNMNLYSLTDIQSDIYFRYFFTFDFRLEDEEVVELVNFVISLQINSNDEKALYYLSESIFKMVNRVCAYSIYEKLKHKANSQGNFKSKFIYYIKIRLQYEYIDTDSGLDNIYNDFYTNPFINKYYTNVIEANNKELPEKIFLRKGKYNINDFDTIKKYFNNWHYETKSEIVLSIINNDYEEINVEKVLSLFNDEERKRFITENYYTISRNEKIFNRIMDNYDDDIYFILSMSKKLGVNFLFKKWDIVKKNERETYRFLAKYYSTSYDDSTLEEAIYKVINFDKGNVLSLLLIEFQCAMNRYIDSRHKRRLRDIIKKDNQDFTLIKKRIGYNNLDDFIQGLNIDIEYENVCENLKEIFKYKYELLTNPRRINFEIYIGHNYTITSISLNENFISEYTSVVGDESDMLKIVLLLVQKIIMSNSDDSIDKKFYEIEEKDRILYEEELKKKSKKVLNELISIVKKDELSKTSEAVNLEPHLIISNNYDNQRKLASFKIGSSKLYVIKNYTEFMYNIINKRIYEYGKSFVFNHNIESFDDSSKEMINMLLGDGKMTNAYYYGYDNRYTLISDANIDKMLTIYKNLFVEFDSGLEKKCYIMEPIDVEFFIDKDYNLYLRNSATKEKINGNIIKGFKKDYLVSDNEIYPLNSSKELRVIQAKLLLSDVINISLIKKNFINEIYARFKENFVIDELIGSDFRLKDLDIEIYLDYKEGIISYYDKFIIDNKEVSSEKLNKEIQLARKYSKYISILSNFGFKDYKLEESDLIYNFLRADLSLLKEVATVFLSENIKDVKTKEYNKVNVYMGYNTGLLDVCFEDSEFTEEELYKIISSLRKKNRYVKLNKNTIVKISEKEEKELLSLVEELRLDPHHLKTNQKVPLYQSLKLMSDLDYTGIKISKNIKEMLNEIANYKRTDFIIPEKFDNVMRDYQKEAFKWIKILSKYSFSGILADDMGLGKSLEIISVIASDEKEMPSLVVCPKSLVYNWYSEFIKWASDIEVYPIVGLSNERHKIMNNFNKDKKQIFLISYDSLKNELELFNKYSFRYLILDEAQFIKNHTTLKAQSVKKINSELRFVLTGTPIENSVIDLWSIFDFLMPNYLYNYSEFKASYEKRIVEKDSTTTERLVKKITPFILRRTKKDVLKDLPEKFEMIRTVEMGKEQQKYYDAQLLKTKMMLEGETNKIEILASLTRLRQLCVDPSMFIEDYKDISCKNEAIIEIIDEYINEHKIIIFSQFTKAFINLEKILRERNVGFAKITGETSAFERISIANDFNDTDKYQVILVSLKAGGTGLNLIGADIVVHLDPWWNVAAENQASDRAHRIGQKNVVQIIKIICKDSIEQKVIELQNVKKDIVDSLISNDDSAIQKLSTDDLKYLLK